MKKTNSDEYILPEIEGLAGYTTDEAKQIVRDYIEDTLAENGMDARVLGLELIGSRLRGNAREDSDLDAVAEYEGTEREDDMFNLLHDEDSPLEIDGVTVDINPIRKEETGTLADYMERSAEYDRDVLSNMYSEEEGATFRVVEDKDTLDRLNNGPTIKVYRAMQLWDGVLYPPMAGKVNGEWQHGIALDELGTVWEQSEERPELANAKGFFKLDKGNGTSVWARYNPYFHTSLTPLNDQFSSAQDRPELVTVEVEVPVSELTSGYKAYKAKDAVGKVEWKAGVIQGKLSGKRTVILSRWDRPMRIVPDSEVADVIVDMFNGKRITMPSNVVTPSLRAELEKRGVPFVETDNQGKRIKNKKESDIRFDVSEGYTEEEQSIIDKAKEDGTYMKAPNGKSSNLNERQWAQVRTKAFKAWFGDWERDPENASKVVDENGEPKVVYHGTDSFGFTVFDRGKSDDARSFFFTDNDNVATGYANARAELNEFLLETGVQHESELSTERGDVYDLYLNMRKPAVIDAEGNEWNEVTVGVHWKLNGKDDETFRDIVERLNEKGFGTYCYINSKGKYEFDYDSTMDALEDIFDVEEREEIEDKEGINFINICDYLVPEIDLDGSCNIVTNTRTINDLAERGGYDGVVFNNIIDSASSKYAEPSTVYSLFDANRIKSATDNNGEFSAENDDIRFKVGDFRDGLTSDDEVYDAMCIPLEWDYATASKLYDSLEKYYKGTIRSASFLAGAAMRSDNMLPFPGGKYTGKDGEYHHIMFEDENGETFVVAVPFEDADIVSGWIEKGEHNDVRFDVSDIDGKSTSELSREFDRALDLQKAGNLPSGYIYKLGYPSSILRSTGFPYAPIELAPSHLTEKMEDAKHPFGYDDVKGLVNALQSPLAVFAYGNKNKAQNVIVKLTRNGKNFVVGVHFNQMPRGIMVSDIRGLFPKDNAQWLNWISQDKALYLDKAEIQALIDQQRTNLAEVEYLDLDSIAKVVKDFDNPIVFEDNLYRVVPEYEDKQALKDIYINGLPSSMDSTLLDIDDELSEDVRWTIAKAAADKGFDFVKATADYLAGADIEEVRPQLEKVREMMRKDIGDEQAITLEDVQWALYQGAHKGENSLFDYISRMSKAESLGHTPQDNELLDKVDDGTRFSISEEMEARSATDMYNRASGYWRNRIKEGLVDMNESVNDLVDAIEKQSGQKADSFEDIRLALNQQSSRGLHDMNRYTSDYLEPMWNAIKSAMRNTGLSYDDISRYVILKHALERNIVFARRDARNDYKDEYAKLIAGIGLDKKEVENRRKQAIVDGDKEGITKCDEELVTLDNEVVRLQSELQTHLEAVEKGTDEKFLEYRKRDYSGLTSMYSDYPGLMPKESYASEVEYEQEARRVRTPMFDNVSDMENAAKSEVKAVEAKDPSAITELWARVNAATKATLTSQYRSNMLTKEQYESVRDQFQYYVPLRGFTDVTAEDVWDYYNDSKSGSFAPTLVSAKGRTSQAENSFIWIGTMASTAIAQNLKNRTKLSLYYFVANRADKQDLVSVRDVWYKYDQDATAEYQAQHPGSVKRIFTPAYPPVFTENLDSDSAKAAYDLWEEEMKKEEEKGNAYRGTQKMDVSDQVAFVSGREKPQHLITMKVRGRELALIINGNPRAAQAINGELNIEASKGYQKVFGPVLRFMSAVNTSYNPEFWISNAQRDILYAWMSTMVQGKSGKGFFKNLVSPKELMRMAREYKAGTLGNGKLETYYKEFAEGGGITGFTVISGNEVWEKKIQSYLEPKVFDKMKNSKFLEFFQDLGEAIEQMSRFSAYISARDEGKSIADAVSDSKEITVNFNRKGSGKNLSFDEVKKLTRKNGRALTKAEQVGVLVLSQIAPASGYIPLQFAP